ncbi:MAG TPA: GAF domain-containing protein [Streptosporangiaceae bacterium]
MSAPDTGTDDMHPVTGATPGRDPPDREPSRQLAAQHAAHLAEQHAGLRRVAALVASAAQPGEVCTAVADELARLVGAEAAFVSRFDQSPGERDEPGACFAVVGSSGAAAESLPVGFEIGLDPGMVAMVALRTGRPARINGERLAQDPFGAIARRLGIQAAMATPVAVGGRNWGVAVAATSREDFPAGTESRMADFMALAAMAIANAQAEQNNAKAKQKLRELADTQASLRRLAMLTARGGPPEAVFGAAAKEVLRHFSNSTAKMVRFELDGTATVIADEGTLGAQERVAGHVEDHLIATVLGTGRAAYIDGYHDIPGMGPSPREGLRSAAAMPVYVHGRLWGMITVGSGPGSLPPDTEQRMTEFAELVATAVANSQSRDELMTSRARVVAASDEVRRRLERDLHDGPQQRLLALALRLSAAGEASFEPGRPGGPGERGELGGPDESETGAEIADIAAELLGVIDDLRELSRGIHPAILSKGGLRPALRALARRSAIPVELDARVDSRLPERIEVGAYYVVSEMLTNAAKHARASVVHVDVKTFGGVLWLHVRDDGIGGADPARGSGLLGLKDRIEALGGTFAFHSPVGLGTTVSCEFPVVAGIRYPDA